MKVSTRPPNHVTGVSRQDLPWYWNAYVPGGDIVAKKQVLYVESSQLTIGTSDRDGCGSTYSFSRAS